MVYKCITVTAGFSTGNVLLVLVVIVILPLLLLVLVVYTSNRTSDGKVALWGQYTGPNTQYKLTDYQTAL